MSKKLNQRKHAKRRAFERFNVSLNRKDLIRMVDAIHKNRAVVVEKQSHRITVFLFPNGWDKVTNAFRVVYDRKRKTIVTLLPPKQDFSVMKRRKSEVEEESHGSITVVVHAGQGVRSMFDC